MRSSAYPEMPCNGRPGVHQKHLGYFFECGPSIKTYRLEAGAEIPGGMPQGHRALFLVSGEVGFDGESFPAFSYFVFPEGVPHGALRARSEAQLLAVGWTLPGKQVPFDLF
jgi:hypothetical protein